MSANQFKIAIAADGESAIMIYDDQHADFLDVTGAVTTRASYVEPTADGQWTADMSPVGGPILGPYRLRSEALATELEFLDKLLF